MVLRTPTCCAACFLSITTVTPRLGWADLVPADRPTGLPKDEVFDPEGDDDHDGVRNAFDRCPTDADNNDRDEDGIPDGCDRCPGGIDADSDGDDVPDGCDNCPGTYNPMIPRSKPDPLYQSNCDCRQHPTPRCCWQEDTDADGVGDACSGDRAPGRIVPVRAIQDGAGATQDSFEYDGDRLVRHTKWDAARQVLLETTYSYDRYGRQTGYTQSPKDGFAAPKTTKIFYDRYGRIIGKLTDGAGENFHYVNKDNEVVMVTTAANPPESAQILDYQTFDGQGRLLKRWRRLPQYEVLVTVTSRSYRDLPDGGYDLLIRDRVDEASEAVREEGYSKGGLKQWERRYPDLVSPHGGPLPPESELTQYDYARTMDKAGNVVAEKWVTIRPSGAREVRQWRIEGGFREPGSRRIAEEYLSTSEVPADEEKKEWAREFYPYSDARDYLDVARRVTTSGEIIEYSRDSRNPELITMESHAKSGSTDGVAKRTYKYDPAGRVVEQVEHLRSGTIETLFQYDYRGRLLSSDSTAGEWTSTTEYRYDAFDRQIAERLDEKRVRAVIYDRQGRPSSLLILPYSGELARLDLKNTTNFLERTTFEYHPVSGRTTREQTTRGNEESSPSQPFVTEIETTYDPTGQWPLEVLHKGEARPRSALYTYNDQGQVSLTTFDNGSVQSIERDGRGLPVVQTEQAHGPERITTLYYNSDGQLEVVEYPDGAFEVQEYDGVGRLRLRKRYPNSSAREPESVVKFGEE